MRSPVAVGRARAGRGRARRVDGARGPEAPRLGRGGGGRDRRGRRGRRDAVGRGEPRARHRLVRAGRRDAALRDAAGVRRARRGDQRARGRREHRPRGHDADGRVLRRSTAPTCSAAGSRGCCSAWSRAARWRSIHAFFAITLRADQIVSGFARQLHRARHHRLRVPQPLRRGGHARRRARGPRHHAADRLDPVLRAGAGAAQPAGLGRADPGAASCRCSCSARRPACACARSARTRARRRRWASRSTGSAISR